jgi:DNA-binding beta-propeller fold protein YncE
MIARRDDVHRRSARTIMLGRSPRAIALDTWTGRAFVITGGSNTVAVLDGMG